jgi:hypothetical protein
MVFVEFGLGDADSQEEKQITLKVEFLGEVSWLLCEKMFEDAYTFH